MGLCGQNGVAISFLTENGRFLARVLGPQTGNVLLRRAQHRMTSDPAQAAELARMVITAKIANARSVLQRARRDHSDRVFPELIETVVDRTACLLRRVAAADAAGADPRHRGGCRQVLFRGVRRADPPAEGGLLSAPAARAARRATT